MYFIFIVRISHLIYILHRHNTGLAWRRHGDYKKAEDYYAKSLHCVHLYEFNPARYRPQVFHTLESIFLLYYFENVASLRLLMTLRALIIAAGERLPDGLENAFGGDSTPHLREKYTISEAERVIQYIIGKSSSVEAMRSAILSFSNRSCRFVEEAVPSENVPNDNQKKERPKDHAREFINECFASSGGFMASCSACGAVKRETVFELCACKNAYYCNTKCQANHWPQHMDECKATRKAAKAKKNKKKNA